MRIAKVDLWGPGWDLRCITTNGTINKAGRCVMGRGTAQQASSKYKGLALEIGDRIKRCGNVVQLFSNIDHTDLATFPVKHNWWETADLDLIKRSAEQLEYLINDWGYIRVALPMPGCGNGGLIWEAVAPVIGFLDDRVTIVTKEDI